MNQRKINKMGGARYHRYLMATNKKYRRRNRNQRPYEKSKHRHGDNVIIHSNKDIFKLVSAYFTDENGCKHLSSKSTGGSAWARVRNRDKDTVYATLYMRGNHLFVEASRWVGDDGLGVNTFMSVGIPAILSAIAGEEPKKVTYKEERKIVLKKKISDWVAFVEELPSAIPELSWFIDTPEEEDEYSLRGHAQERIAAMRAIHQKSRRT